MAGIFGHPVESRQFTVGEHTEQVDDSGGQRLAGCGRIRVGVTHVGEGIRRQTGRFRRNRRADDQTNPRS
jgi:hypothetical protein